MNLVRLCRNNVSSLRSLFTESATISALDGRSVDPAGLFDVSRNAHHITRKYARMLKKYKLADIPGHELLEKNVQGGGPGGQAVNKAHNAVFLKHLPTGLHVKVHQARAIHQNRAIAYRKLQEMLDELRHGEHSYLSLKRRRDEERADVREMLRLRKKERMERKKRLKELREAGDIQ